jgi:hypothetical protein
VLTLQATKLGPFHRDTLVSGETLASAYELLGRWTEAEQLLRDIVARHRKSVPLDDAKVAGNLTELGHVLLVGQSRSSEAEPLFREALSIYEKSRPDHWGRYRAMILLGGTLFAQRHYREAESLLLAGHEAL